MPEWRVELMGEGIDLQYVYQAFARGDPCVIREGDQYFLKANEFATHDDAESVRNRAKDITKIISDSVHLHYRDSRQIRIGRIIQIDDNGQRRFFVFGEGNIQLRGDIAGFEINGIDATTGEHNAIKIFRSASSHEDLAAALAYFNQGDWNNLYKSYELVRDYVGNESLLIKSGWITKGLLSRFTQTAQSREAIGDSARHASKKYKAPNNPMPIHEARALLGALLEKWVKIVSKT